MSSDSKTFFAVEISLLIAPIKKLLIEIDLSESTSIFFLNEDILLFIIKLKLFDNIMFKKIENQNNVLLLSMILATLAKFLQQEQFVHQEHKLDQLSQINFLHYDR